MTGTYVFSALTGRSWDPTLGALHSPGIIFIPFMFLLQGTCLVAAKMGLPPDGSFTSVYSSLILVVCCACPFAVYWVVIRKVKQKAYMIPDPMLFPQEGLPRYSGEKLALYKFVFGERIWVSNGHTGYFTEKYGVVFESYKETTTWWCVLEIATICLVGLLSRWKPGGEGECNVRNLLFCFVFGAFFAALCFYRPYVSKMDNTLMGAIAGGLFLAVVLMTFAIIGKASTGGVAYSIAAVLLLATAVLTLMKACADICWYIADMLLQRRRRARDLNRQQQSKLLDATTLQFTHGFSPELYHERSAVPDQGWAELTNLKSPSAGSAGESLLDGANDTATASPVLAATESSRSRPPPHKPPKAPFSSLYHDAPSLNSSTASAVIPLTSRESSSSRPSRRGPATAVSYKI